MSIPPAVVMAARAVWNWEWQRLMGGLGPADEEGNYRRPESDHLEAVLPQPSELIDRNPSDRPHLILGRSCPWAHRTWLMLQLRGLNDQVGLTMARADHRAGRWQLDPPWLGCDTLLALYRHCQAPPSYRATVPVLIDPLRLKILGNESAQLVELLNSWPAPPEAPNLAPKDQQSTIERWQSLLQPNVNDGVYRCGFARNQRAYDKASSALFQALTQVNESLKRQGPWLCGSQLTLADVRLFPTLIRWETVYAPLFGCSGHQLWEFPQLWSWRQRFFALPGVAETCDAEAWTRDYFGALFPLNPGGIVPSAPILSRLIQSPVAHP